MKISSKHVQIHFQTQKKAKKVSKMDIYIYGRGRTADGKRRKWKHSNIVVKIM